MADLGGKKIFARNALQVDSGLLPTTSVGCCVCANTSVNSIHPPAGPPHLPIPPDLSNVAQKLGITSSIT